MERRVYNRRVFGGGSDGGAAATRTGAAPLRPARPPAIIGPVIDPAR
jgi:hypothetical protein